MKKRKKLSRIIFIFVALLISVALFIEGFIAYKIVVKEINKNFTTSSQQIVQATKSMIDNRVIQYRNKLSALIEDADFSNYEDLRKQLVLTVNEDPTLLNIYFADNSNGMLIDGFSSDYVQDFDPRESEWFKNSMKSPNEFMNQPPYNDIVTNKSVVTIFKAIVKNGVFLGVIGMDIELNELSKEYTSLEFGTNGEVTIVDSNEGFVISDSDPSKVGGTEPVEYSNWNEFVNNESGVFYNTFKDVNYAGYYDTSDLTGWKVIAKIEKEELNKSIYRLGIAMLITEIVAIITCLIIIRIGLKKLTNSIASITKLLKRISDGELDFEVDVDAKTEEIGVIKESVKDMRDNMHEVLYHVDEEVEGLNNDSVKYLALSEEIAVSIEQVHTTIDEITQGTIQSAEGLESIARQMSDLSSSLDKMESGSDEVNTMAIEANNLSGKGLNMVSVVMDKAHETMNSTSEVKDVVEQVSESIVKIKMINETIKEFTEQTNLLALNAAIEAARAGEYGKGFAVVAEEIRKLAEETAVSSEQIDEIVREVDEKSRTAAIKVEDTVYIVQSQNEAVDETKRVFGEIISSIESLTERVYNINDGVTKINGMKGKVLEQVENLSAILEETAAGTEEVTASSQEVASAAQDFVGNFKEMKKMTEELKGNVSKFKM